MVACDAIVAELLKGGMDVGRGVAGQWLFFIGMGDGDLP